MVIVDWRRERDLLRTALTFLTRLPVGRGLVFDRDSLAATGKRPAVIDLSELPDALIGQVDLIRIRRDVSLRYDPSSRQLVLHVDPPAAATTAAQ